MSDPRAVRFGYVGCGFMAQKVHLPNFGGILGCERLASAEVRTGQPSRSSGEDTLADVRLFEEMYRAYRHGQRVL